MLKTNKSLSKRLKVTKTGKIVRRRQGLGHFNAKAKRSKQLAQKRAVLYPMKSKDINRYLSSI